MKTSGPILSWEIYQNEKPKRAELYERAERLARVTAYTKRGLWWKMRKVDKRLNVKTLKF